MDGCWTWLLFLLFPFYVQVRWKWADASSCCPKEQCRAGPCPQKRNSGIIPGLWSSVWCLFPVVILHVLSPSLIYLSWPFFPTWQGRWSRLNHLLENWHLPTLLLNLFSVTTAFPFLTTALSSSHRITAICYLNTRLSNPSIKSSHDCQLKMQKSHVC